MIKARILLLLTVIFWGWTFVFTKVCLDYINPVEILGLRLLIAIPILGALLFFKRIKIDFKGQWGRMALASTVITLHFLIQITGIKYTSATNTGWIIALTPLIIAVLAWLILKEMIGRNIIVGIAVASSGVILLVSGGKIADLGWLSSYGDWLVLGSAHTWALYTIATRDISRNYNPMSVTFAVLFPAFILTIAYMIFYSDWTVIMHLPARVIFAVFFLGIMGTAMGHWFWQEGIARVGAAEAAIYLYLEPLATTALAVPYLGEKFGFYTALGAALVILGVWYGQRKLGINID